MTENTAADSSKSVGTLKQRNSGYPVRGSFFFHRFVRLLAKSCAANVIGDSGCWLLTAVAATEDSRRYRSPPTFFNEQLAPMCGWSVDKLGRVRSACIENGYLHYDQARKRTPAIYWCLVPDGQEDWTDNGPLGEDPSDFLPQLAEHSAEESAEQTATQSRGKCRSNREETAEPPYLIPNPQPIPSPPSDWGKVKGELIEFGIKAPKSIIDSAQEHGYSPQRLSELIAHCRTRPDVWEPGAISHRIQNTPPDVVAHEGCWPTPREPTKPTQSELGPLLSKYETDFRRLHDDQILELGRRAKIDQAKLAKLTEVGRDTAIRGADRERLLLELARENGEWPARVQNAATHDQAG